MSKSSYSDDFYKDRVATRAATKTPTFKHDADIKAGAVKATVHATLDAHGKIRESRDSDACPESTPIAVIFDVTGSMAEVPKVMQTKLPQLMGLLLRKGYVAGPQICFGAVGDFFADKAPLQIGQFEIGLEMDDNVTALYLEGGGGGSNQESYQDALYFFAHRVSADAFEKRGVKGYLFLIGDERCYPYARKDELQKLMGVTVQSDVPLEQIVEAVKEKWNVFFIIPNGTSNYGSSWLRSHWEGLLGPQNVIHLQDPSAVCETIGSAIGLCEGVVDADGMAADLKDIGASASIISATSGGLRGLADSVSLARVGSGDLPERTGRSTSVARL